MRKPIATCTLLLATIGWPRCRAAGERNARWQYEHGPQRWPDIQQAAAGGAYSTNESLETKGQFCIGIVYCFDRLAPSVHAAPVACLAIQCCCDC